MIWYLKKLSYKMSSPYKDILFGYYSIYIVTGKWDSSQFNFNFVIFLNYFIPKDFANLFTKGKEVIESQMDDVFSPLSFELLLSFIWFVVPMQLAAFPTSLNPNFSNSVFWFQNFINFNHNIRYLCTRITH